MKVSFPDGCSSGKWFWHLVDTFVSRTFLSILPIRKKKTKTKNYFFHQLHGYWWLCRLCYSRCCCLVVYVLWNWSTNVILAFNSSFVLPWQRLSRLQGNWLQVVQRTRTNDNGPIRIGNHWNVERHEQVSRFSKKQNKQIQLRQLQLHFAT